MSLSKKLQVPPGTKVCVINAPKGLALGVPTTRDATAGAVLVFVRNKRELGAKAGPAVEAARADRLAWVAYPKAGQLDTDLNRDVLWKELARRGVRPVRQVSVDDVWSALRFRPGGD